MKFQLRETLLLLEQGFGSRSLGLNVTHVVLLAGWIYDASSDYNIVSMEQAER